MFKRNNMDDDQIGNSNESSIELMQIANINYYNERQQLIRVNPAGSSKYYDVRLYGTVLIPNPNEYMCIVMAGKTFFEGPGLSEERLQYIPGYLDKVGTIADMPAAIGFLVSKSQDIKVADPQSGSAGFNISEINMFDQDKVKIAITPPIDKSYTNNNKDENQNLIGLFMNGKTVMLRSAGGSITLGEEGVHIGGKVFLQGGKQSKDVVMDNPLHGLIPQTIPTAIVSIPQIPNFAMLLEIANSANKVANVVLKGAKVGSIIGRSI